MQIEKTRSQSSGFEPSVDLKDPKDMGEVEKEWRHPAGFSEEEAYFMSNFTEEQRKKVVKKVGLLVFSLNLYL